MPVRWDSGSDQKLLLKILEAHPALSVDVAKVAEIWAEGGDGERPTPRAIRERLGTIRKQAGINTPIKTTGSGVKPQEVGRGQAKTQPQSSAQKATRIKDESKHTDTPTTESTANDKLKFIRSSFSTPFGTTGKKRNSNGGQKRKSRLYDYSDEDEAISTGESASDDGADATREATASARSSKRRRTIANAKYILSSSDEGKQVSDDSDGGYDPVAENEKKEAKKEKRGRVREMDVQDDDIAEEI